jgi:hypothetical protein
VPTYIELPVDGSDNIKVEISTEGLVRAGATEVIGRATARLDHAVDQVVKLGEQALRKAQDAAQAPDSLELELGLKLTAKTGFVIAESTGEAHVKVTLKWTLDRAG